MSFTVRQLRDSPPRRTRRAVVRTAAGVLMNAGFGAMRKMKAQHAAQKQQLARVNMLKRLTTILVAVLCILLLFAATVRALAALQLISVQSVVQMAAATLPADQYGHTNILLLGQGDASHEGTDLTDTIMLASVDPQHTHSVTLLSLPRDLYFLEPRHLQPDRINTFYRDAKIQFERDGLDTQTASAKAMRLLADEVSSALDVEIHHIAKVDFIGFVQAVDAIGGIDIVVPEPLVDTEYPGPNYTYETFRLDAGTQHLDGETALKYARSRHSTSDFDRSARQQQILSALATRMREDGLLTRATQISELLGIMREHVETTLTVREMAAMAGWADSIDRSRILTAQLNTENGLYGAFSAPGGLLYTPPRDQFKGASVLLPVSIPEFPVTWKQIRAFVQVLVHEREAILSPAQLHILNAGAAPGMARRVANECIRFGFTVETIENAPDDTETSYVSGSTDDPLARRIAEILDIEFRPIAPPALQEGETAAPLPATVYLGEDYEHRALQDGILQTHHTPSSSSASSSPSA